jgi:hypothetical protein
LLCHGHGSREEKSNGKQKKKERVKGSEGEELKKKSRTK